MYYQNILDSFTEYYIDCGSDTRTLSIYQFRQIIIYYIIYYVLEVLC